MNLQPNLPLQGSGKQRGVVYESSWETTAALVEPDAVRFDEMCWALTWRMENAADGCPQLEHSPFRIARAKDPSGAVIRAFFTITPDDEMVRAWYVDRMPESEEEDSSSL